MVKAYLKNYRQSPRKVRLVVDLVRGKKVNDALTILEFTPKRASSQILKLIESAIANAKHNYNLGSENLFIKEITVDEGPTLNRWRARARGAAAPIRKRTSHIRVVLDTKESKASTKKEVKAIEEVVEKKEKVKKTKTVAKKASAKKTVKKDNNK